MNRLIKFSLFLWFVLLLGVALISGCASLTPHTAATAAKVVNHYCLEPETSRAVVRAQVDTLIDPHKLRITCAGDVP